MRMQKRSKETARKAFLVRALAVVFVAGVGASACGSDEPAPATGGAGNTSAGGKAGSGGKGTGGTGKGGSGGKASGGGSGTGGSGGGGGGTADSGSGGTATGGASGSGGSSGADSGAGGAGGTAGADAGSLIGNGHIDPGEECDDNNRLDGDDCTSLGTDNRPCLACTANFCPFDTTFQPRCSDYPDAKSRDACYATFACLVRTECFLNVDGAQYCYCGAADPVTCRDGNGTGACKAVIDKAFADSPGPLTVVDSNAIVNNFTDVRIPAAGALSLMQCAAGDCGDTGLGRGNFECSPTKHPPFAAGDAGRD